MSGYERRGDFCRDCRHWLPMFEHYYDPDTGEHIEREKGYGVCGGFNQDGRGKTYYTVPDDGCPLFEEGGGDAA